MEQGRPEEARHIIVGVDKKTGGVHAHPVKCKGTGDPWIDTRIAADIEELGYGGSRVFLEADQEVAIADVQRQVVAVRLGDTVSMNIPLGELQSNGRVEEEIECESQVKRHDIPVDGRVVSRADHKICEKAKQAEPLTERLADNDGIWLGLGMKSDESIIGTPNGVSKSKTVRRRGSQRIKDGVRKKCGAHAQQLPHQTRQ